MNTQPEALRLADWMQVRPPEQIELQDLEEAAAELRRLHTLNQELLKALNRSLDVLEYYSDMTEGPSTASGEALIVRAAIAKAQGETK